MRVVGLLEVCSPRDAQFWIPKAGKEELLVPVELLYGGNDAPPHRTALQGKPGAKETVEPFCVVRVALPGFRSDERLDDDREGSRDPILVFEVGNAVHNLDRPALIFRTRSVVEAIAHLCQLLLKALDDPLNRADF